ncbi:Mus7/MMS22 family domain-containing protein [Trichoderma austrokoningii]
MFLDSRKQCFLTMSDWRERGEVADSEDEGEFLSEDESPTISPTQFATKASVPTNQVAASIWDFPESDDDEQSRVPISKSSPLSSGPDLREENQLLNTSPSRTEDVFQNQVRPSPLEKVRAKPPSNASTTNDIVSHNRQGALNASSPKYRSTATTRNDGITTSASSPSMSPNNTAAAQISEGSQHDTHWEPTVATSARHTHSLRQRKPQQQYPYSYDNVYHRIFFPQLGVKPMKIPTDIGGRHQLAGPLPDESFDQYTPSDDLPPGTDRTDDGSFTATQSEHGEPDMATASLVLSQSRRPSAAHSLSSSATDTVGHIALDQDLPGLEELLNGQLPASGDEIANHEPSQVLRLTQRARRRDVIYSDPPEPITTISRISISPSRLSMSPELDTQQKPLSNPNIPIDWDDPFGDLIPGPLVSATPIEVSSQELNNQEHDQQGYSEESETGDKAENDAYQLVTTYRRRIKGVLPASWLRLDQQLSKNNDRKGLKKKTQHRLPIEQQRGVALKKKSASDSTALDLLPLELDQESLADYTTDDASERQAERSASPPTPNQEIDQFDDMPVIVGSKRQLRLPKASVSTRKRTKLSNGSRVKSVQTRRRQKTIDSFLFSQSDVLPESPVIGQFSNNASQMSKQKHGKSFDKPKPRMRSIPLLSILDTIEPGAPRFIRIAARSAKQTLSQGRSNVQQKVIKLATRQDQVDAMSILEKWKSGVIQQRPSVSTASKSKRMQRHRTNMYQKRSNAGFTSQPKFSTLRNSSRRLVKYLDNSGSAGYRRSDSYQSTNTGLELDMNEMNPSSLPSPISRAAQLEVDERTRRSRMSFTSRKGTLDHIFRTQKQMGPNWRLSGNTKATATSSTATGLTRPEPAALEASREPERTRSRPQRFRKSIKPRRIDIRAPQYTHVNDPIPIHSSVVDAESLPEKSKLYGLAPYGIQYTSHFEIFPLMSDVRFHESTLLGSGILTKLWMRDPRLEMPSGETRISVRFGEQDFDWGSWNEKVSSEIGILFDAIAERLEDSQRSNLHDDNCAINAIHSTLEYARDALGSARSESPIPLLISRLQEVFHGFIARIEAGLDRSLINYAKDGNFILKMLDEVLIASSLLLYSCQKMPQLADQQSAVEELLLSLSQLMASMLLRGGLNQVKQIYNDFGQLNRRDRTLRDNVVAVHSWTLLIQVFEYLSPQQLSFWSVLERVVLQPHVLSGTDVLAFETAWETMFTLLPLFKFDSTGRIATEESYNKRAEGWAIPQKLIRRVFQLYQDNNHQAASFNSYCRTLVSRCHYLVQQWGWFHSAPVVGVIFDFFGSQKFANLRNEEVYQSPEFMNNLSGRPTLEIEPDDCCFHIFLKLLAVSIKKLRQFSSEKDIRNLVTRTIPNHSRLYLKEHKILERDLAALRNHHDLIGTLFWAAPSGVRPSVTLIEGLVTPASSHKEACLINIRAWAQLASFIVSSGEAKKFFEPFREWRHTFFQQTITQFDGIAAEIYQQYLALSKDANQSVTQDVAEAMISQNKAAVVDTLYLSFAASAKVMREALDLEAATYCLNTPHLERIFQYFTVPLPELDWSILRVALTILDMFVSRIEEFKSSQESQQGESQILDSAQADDAFLILEQDISRTYFAMARCILSLPTEMLNQPVADTADKAVCVRQVITLSARMGIGFINCGLLKLSDMFQSGKFCLFSDEQHLLDPSQRRSFISFTSTLLDHGFDDFSNAGFTIPEVWVLALITPLKYLKYETLFALQRYCFNKGIIPENIINSTTQPSYKTNKRLFDLTVSSLRKITRSLEPGTGRPLPKILELAMRLMQHDLGVMYTDGSQHQKYVVFVQGIVSSIRAHGSGLCMVNNFFLQVSKEYSPPIQDPHLQIASMLSYGILIEEGEEARGSKQLFFLLLSNFKHALANGKPTDDARMLRKGMKHKSILAFVLGKMLPAIIRVSFTLSSCFPLLDSYVTALRLLLMGRVLSQQLDECDLSHVSVTVQAIVEGMKRMRLSGEVLSGPRIHILGQAMNILNLLWPSLLIANAQWPYNTWLANIACTLLDIASFTEVAQLYLCDIVEMGNDSLDADLLFEGLEVKHPLTFDANVDYFTNYIKDDISRNWTISSTRILIQVPQKPKGQSQQDGNGMEIPNWVEKDIILEVYNEIQEWNSWWARLKKLEKGYYIVPNNYYLGLEIF